MGLCEGSGESRGGRRLKGWDTLEGWRWRQREEQRAAREARRRATEGAWPHGIIRVQAGVGWAKTARAGGIRGVEGWIILPGPDAMRVSRNPALPRRWVLSVRRALERILRPGAHRSILPCSAAGEVSAGAAGCTRLLSSESSCIWLVLLPHKPSARRVAAGASLRCGPLSRAETPRARPTTGADDPQFP